MQPFTLFISYPHKARGDIERIRRHFPRHIHDALDINTLELGANWKKEVQSQVTNADYVLLYVNEDAASSEAMKEELNWILSKERYTGKGMLLPVVTDPNLLHSGYLSDLHDRNYTLFYKRGVAGEVLEKTEEDYKHLVTEILAQLSVLLLKEREEVAYKSRTPLLVNSDVEPMSADDHKMACAIADLVLGTCQQSPRHYDRVIQTLARQDIRTREDVQNVVKDLTDRKIIGGIYFRHNGIFEASDHYKLKALQALDDKIGIAELAIDQIDNGDIVIIDTGSTCNEVAKELVRHIGEGMLFGLDVIVCSASAAMPFLDNLDLKVHNIDPIVQLHIRGGKVRLRNHAVVKGDSLLSYTDVSAISETIRTGRKVKAFLGCNYFDEKGRFYSIESDEAENKKQIMSPADEVFVLATAGKALNDCDPKRYLFADAGRNHSDITLIVGGYFDDAKRNNIISAGVKVLTTRESKNAVSL